MSLLSKIKSLFTKKEDLKGEIKSNILFTNDYVNLVYDACVISHGGSTDKTEDKKEKFIAKIVELGHESVLEHSNIIIGMKFSTNYSESLSKLLSYIKFLNKHLKVKDNINYLIIGGSIRGLKESIKSIEPKDFEDPVIKSFISLMYNIKSCFFTDFINDGILDKNLFNNIIIGDSLKYTNSEDIDENIQEDEESYYKNIIEGTKSNICSVDNINHIKQISDNYFGKDIFIREDLIDITSLTVLFKDCTRAISHQLVRHRNGITQSSQRYIDIKDFKFHSPDEFKKDYDPEKIYEISFTDGKTTFKGKYTLQSLGQCISNVYNQLRDQGVEKEDARYYSPNGISTSLYMTFNLRMFIMFFKLRSAKGAQAEIRMIENELEILFDRYILQSGLNLSRIELYTYLNPRYQKKIIETNSIIENVDEIL